MFPLYPFSADFLFFNPKWVLNFPKSFSASTEMITWDMVFILLFVNMFYHIDQFAYTDESLHPLDKPCLIMMYNSLNVLLDLDCYYFVEE